MDQVPLRRSPRIAALRLKRSGFSSVPAVAQVSPVAPSPILSDSRSVVDVPGVVDEVEIVPTNDVLVTQELDHPDRPVVVSFCCSVGGSRVESPCSDLVVSRSGIMALASLRGLTHMIPSSFSFLTLCWLFQSYSSFLCSLLVSADSVSCTQVASLVNWYESSLLRGLSEGDRVLSCCSDIERAFRAVLLSVSDAGYTVPCRFTGRCRCWDFCRFVSPFYYSLLDRRGNCVRSVTNDVFYSLVTRAFVSYLSYLCCEEIERPDLLLDPMFINVLVPFVLANIRSAALSRLFFMFAGMDSELVRQWHLEHRF